MATKVLFFIALSLAVISSFIPFATAVSQVKGCVYCDTCRAGFETNVTSYIQGARVAIQCHERKSMNQVFHKEAVTDSTGTYTIIVENDHHDHICRSILVSSPLSWCNTPDKGRDTSSLVLTYHNNGVVNHLHYANAMGFLKDEPLPECKGLLKYYLEDSDV